MPSRPIHLESDTQKLVDAIAPRSNFDSEEKRVALEELQSKSTNELPVDIEDLKIADGSNNKVPIRILRPQNSPWMLPVMIYIHGGGWVSGNAHTHDRLIRELVLGVQAAAVVPEYSLSPEARYPTAVEEIYCVLQWIADHGVEHNLDPKRITVVGDNVGGNMAAVTTLITRERGGPVIHHQILLYPVVNAAFNTESYHQFAEGYYLSREEMMWLWDQYTTNSDERNEITVSPLRSGIEQLKGLPPALVITAEADVLRDEGEAYADNLRKAGVDVTAVRFQGTVHDFLMLNVLANTQATRAAMALSIVWMRAGFSLINKE